MKFSEALEKYLEARDSLHHAYRSDGGKQDDRATMRECAQRMDELAGNLLTGRAAEQADAAMGEARKGANHG